jgi:chaperonin cofactor prefoldin
MALTAALGLVGYFLKSWLERVDSRLEKLDARVASLSTHQARVEERITALENKL